MLKRCSLLAVLATVLLSYSVVRSDEAEEKKFKPLCPVSGKEALETESVAYKEAKVYFCCPNCPKAFEKDTAKFAAKANHQLVGTQQYKEVKCPLTGRQLNPDTAIEVSGVEVAFCCNNCKGKAEKAEGDEQIALIFSDANFKKGYEKADKEKKKLKFNFRRNDEN